MSKQTWPQRRTRLARLIGIDDDQPVDEDAEAWVLDDYIWNNRALGRTPQHSTEIEKLKFGDRDIEPLGTVAKGQFGLVEVVRCKIDQQLYACKSVDKKLALRAREQCFPQIERDILLRAHTTSAKWVPRLLCAFQTPEKLTLLMDYADGGNLWDVVEAHADTGSRVAETDLRWWMSQAACAIEWCHSQGFVHRDVKPHNFVFDSTLRLRLVDFGSAAALLPATRDGVQLVPKRLCLVPCGTCDYISPEILNAHEEALVALETDAAEDSAVHDPSMGGYGKEVDWWSFGAMFYEMAFGVAPFYAKDIRRTYTKIVDHQRHLAFPTPSVVSTPCVDLLSRLLCDHESRLGRRSAREVRAHAFFRHTDWASLHLQKAPTGLRLPQLTNAPPPIAPTLPAEESLTEDYASRASAEDGGGPFDFSALFQSTMTPLAAASATRSKSLNTTAYNSKSPKVRDSAAIAAFIGFSWGPAVDAFSHSAAPVAARVTPAFVDNDATPRPIRRLGAPRSEPLHHPTAFVTPLRPGLTPATIPRSAMRRGLSDREALRQLVDCVTVSARKRVLESGRTPRLPMLRGVAFRNSDDGSSATTASGSETDDGHTMPPSPSPSPRPSSRLSGRMNMLSMSNSGDRSNSRSLSTPTLASGARSPFMPSGEISLPDPSVEATPRKPLSPPARRSTPPMRQPVLPAVVRPASQHTLPPPKKQSSRLSGRDGALDAEEEALTRKIEDMTARHEMLQSHISDLEHRIAQAAIPQHM
ncbi:kinase-like protein [Exidia glandulosa HHB12029]|uniref:non-specific serine/threonine protein kinase n=1 Tax=Exidia glandulosa HHB12029 TaxID=1314781 RepID=A0A165GI27_EXIGL|nr:kinase-like protein [Exidia glandulosa HHB12029]